MYQVWCLDSENHDKKKWKKGLCRELEDILTTESKLV